MTTICALATPRGVSGVAVIRVSGNDALNVAKFLGVTTQLIPRYAHYERLNSPLTGEIIDEVLILYFKGPASFTGEDVLEIQCHGSKAIITELLDTILSMETVSYAEAGEFSKRALFNNKMDFIQSEALLDIIHSETKLQKDLAFRQYGGVVSNLYHDFEEEIIEVRAFTEACLDFPDEDLPESIMLQIDQKLELLLLSAMSLYSNAIKGNKIKDGISVAVIGLPNAGKSSLLNRLANEEVSIVSEFSGTTRDVISTHIEFKGVPFIFYDTAGIRKTDDFVESIGIDRALKKALECEVALEVIDASSASSHDDTFSKNVSRETIRVYNKCDLIDMENVSRETLYVSAKNGVGFQALISRFEEIARELNDPAALSTNSRHIKHLSMVVAIIENAIAQDDLVLKAEFLIQASNEVGAILGRVGIEKILDSLFSSFCIGK